MSTRSIRPFGRLGWSLGLACVVGALTPAAYAGRVYVSNEDGHTVSVLDTERSALIATIEVGKRPRGMKLNRDGSRLFVALSGLPKCPPTTPDEECAKLERDLKADGVAIVDTAASKVIKVLQAGSDPEQFDLSADGKRLFVANEDIATTSVVDIESGQVIARVPVGREPEGVVTSPDGNWVLVTNESDNSISVIDARTLKVVKSVQVGKRPRDLAFTPDSAAAYVSGEFDSSLYRIAVPGGEPVQRVLQLRKEARPMAVVLDAKRNRLFMSTGRGGTVAVIDLKGPTLTTEIKVGTRPWGTALSEDGRWLYTANGPSNDVSVIDTATLRTVKTIAVGKSPWGVVVGPTPPTAADAKNRTSLDEAALLQSLGLRLAKEFREFLRLVGVAEQTAAFARQSRVLRVSASLDEIIVAKAFRDLVDDARTLVEARELSTVFCDAFVDVFDARLRRIVVHGRFGAQRPGEEAQKERCGYARRAGMA
jgi:YVTN family beta-propeller protein